MRELSDEERELLCIGLMVQVRPTPPGHWIAIVTRLLSEGGYGLEQASVTYAKLSITLADAFIVCWREKYQYNLLRPISYIQKVIDVNWNNPDITDPVVTPPFPEYPSGHSVQSSAAATVLTDLFGEVPYRPHSRQTWLRATRVFFLLGGCSGSCSLEAVWGTFPCGY